jgi:hypothetical protein
MRMIFPTKPLILWGRGHPPQADPSLAPAVDGPNQPSDDHRPLGRPHGNPYPTSRSSTSWRTCATKWGSAITAENAAVKAASAAMTAELALHRVEVAKITRLRRTAHRVPLYRSFIRPIAHALLRLAGVSERGRAN